MNIERVSFKVAKAIKEVGYPQNKYKNFFVEKDYNSFRIGNLYEPCNMEISSEVPFITAPTYLEVWLWLMREMKIHIDISTHFDSIKGYYNIAIICCNGLYKSIEAEDPEEAIIAAIDYLVDSNLIK